MQTTMQPEQLDALRVSFGQALRKEFGSALRQEREREAERLNSSASPSVLARAGSVARDVGGGVLEAPKQVYRGIGEAINETSDAASSLANWLNDNLMDLGTLQVGKDASNGVVGWRSGGTKENDLRVPDSALPDEADTVTGGFVNDASQFVTGMIGAGKFLKVTRLSKLTAKTGVVGQGLVKGAIADATVFDPHEERLSNLVESHPALGNRVTAYLAADEDDSELEGRLKNAVEGAGLGVAAEGLVAAVKAIKLSRKGKLEEAEEVLDQASPKAEEPAPEEPKAEPEEPKGAATAPEGEPKPPKKLLEVDDDKLRELTAQRIREDGFGQGRNVSGIRTDLIESEADLDSIMSSLRVVYREEMDKAIGGDENNVRTFAQVQENADRLADLIGDDPRLLMQRLGAMHDNTMHMDAELRVYEDLLVTTGDKLHDIAELVADPLGGVGTYKDRAELMQAFASHYELMGNLQARYKGIQTNVARSLNAMKMGGKSRAKMRDAIDPDEMFRGGMRNMVALARRYAAAGRNTKAQAALTRGGFVKRFINSVSEYWINSILSGAKTHVVNVAANAVTTALLPAEKALAGAMRGSTPEGRNLMMEGGLQYLGMVQSLRDAVTLSSRSFKLGDNILDPSQGKIELHHAITADNWNAKRPSTQALVNGLGTLVRMPGRFLLSEDEFFKQLTYRSDVRAKAMREAFQMGLGKRPKDFALHVQKALDGAVDKDGAAVNREALEKARTATFTNNLKADTWTGARTFGQTFQEATEAHPALRLVMPFVRTPSNLLRFVWVRTPALNLLRKQYVDDIRGRNGSEAQAMAQAQMASGAALWGTAVSFAIDGTVTGAGPADHTVRKAMMETGWRPYSFRITNDDGSTSYVDYRRMDPFASFFGIAADFTETLSHHPERTRDEIATAMAVALAKNLSNKTYLKGLSDAMAALAEPDRKMQRFVEQFAGGFVPNVLNQQFKNDAHLREVDGVIQALRSRTPGLSETLDPVRNFLGEPVNVPPALGPDFLSPFTRTVHTGMDQPMTEEWKYTPQGDVYDELARQSLIHNSPLKVPAKKRGQVDLTAFTSPVTGKTAWDRLQELTGTTEISGETLKQTLEGLFKSDAYKNGLTDGEEDFDGSRIEQIRKIVGYYRMKAELELREEIPELSMALEQEKQRRWLTKAQGRQPAQQ